MREWIAEGLRRGMTFKALAKRAGVCERTLRRWSAAFREESALRATPDCEEQAFIELVEGAEKPSRIEIVLADERRVVVDGATLIEVLARVLTSVERC
jgi:transposase-like protein